MCVCVFVCVLEAVGGLFATMELRICVVLSFECYADMSSKESHVQGH